MASPTDFEPIDWNPADAPPPAPQNDFLYHFCFWTTWALFAVNIAEFLGARPVPGSTLSSVYFAVLTAYAADKELGKWKGAAPAPVEASRRGEWFVAAWIAFAFIAPIASAWIAPNRLHEPHDLAAITLEVVAVFFGTKASRRLRATAALSNRILSVLQGSQGLTTMELAEQANGHPRTVQRELAKLVALGKVSRAGKATDPNTRYKLA